ncbi:MAG TPA: aliphatic sulfonate ABC transporter substrate-binding protein [Stellaceae bacterium]|jgi:sulfonate transport system substrate-binding protein|nr:aliphatic sulfonate ABC transporter substrate-binding protein [Stellaceae bacterium]
MPTIVPRLARVFLALALVALALPATAAEKLSTLRLDWAYYSPVSLVLRDKGWMEQEFAKDGIHVEWVLSLGSNKALEFLNGDSIDFGSSAGAAALMAKANGVPIKAVYVFDKPEWTALVTLKDSPIHTVKDLRGKRIAVTRGTDPHIFLLRALALNGMKSEDVKMVLLQHPDGRVALERGDVDAWAGLDPYMAETELEKGSRLFFRDPDLNTYGFLNTREAFAAAHPDIVERVLAVYERARKWSIAHPAELRAVVAKAGKLTDAVAAKDLERNDLSSGMIGKRQRDCIVAAGDVLKQSGIIPADTDIAKTADALIDPQYIVRVTQRLEAGR